MSQKLIENHSTTVQTSCLYKAETSYLQKCEFLIIYTGGTMNFIPGICQL